MLKDEIRKVLATYSPPLASSQMDQIAETIAEMSAKEKKSLKTEGSAKSRR